MQLLVHSESERFGIVAITSHFVTEASYTLRTSPVRPQCPYNMRMMRGTATYQLFDLYATMLSARRLSNNKRQHSPCPHVAAIKNQRISRDSSSDHASEVAELRDLLRDARESIYRLARRNSTPPTDITPKAPRHSPTAIRCSLPDRVTFTSGNQEPVGYNPRPRRGTIPASKTWRRLT